MIIHQGKKVNKIPKFIDSAQRNKKSISVLCEMLFRSFSAAHIQQRIHFLAIFNYLKMQVSTGGISCAADQRDGLAL